MKKTILILSLVWANGCAGFPKKNLYVVDLANQVCAEYELISVCEVKFRLVRELKLEPKGPCDRMAGWARGDFKEVQNWVRDNNPECKK